MSRPTNVAQLRKIISTASPSAIEIALSDLLASSPDQWMTSRQKYADGRNRAGLSRSHPLPLRSAEALKQYVAASVFLHTADSWSLIGRAMSCFATGDVPVAQHLLYYSELRAAQAILARHGIVVFNKNPFCFDGSSTKGLASVLANPSTHQATWDVFSAWADEFASDFVGDTIRVATYTATEWAAARPVPVSLDAVASLLMKRWGLDLSVMRADRNLRNSVSYEPSGLMKSDKVMSPAAVGRAFNGIWSLLEPNGSTNLENFDLALLRHLLQVSFESANGVKHASGRRFQADTQATLANLGITVRASALARYFNSNLADDDLLHLAKLVPPSRPRSDEKEFLAMRSRAAILARFALGAARNLTDKSGVSRSSISFWADSMLTTHAVDLEAANSYLDLWSETAAALEDIAPMQLLTSSDDFPRTREWAEPIGRLSSFERVAAWAVA